MKRVAMLAGLLCLGALSAPVWAQAPAPTAPPAPVSGGGSAALSAMAIIVALMVLLGITVKLFDLRRKREAEAVQLQAQVSDVLLRDQALFGLPVTPTAHVPLLKGSPATVEVAGQVPAPELKEAVLRVVRAEAARIRPDVVVEDRIAVVPTMAHAA